MKHSVAAENRKVSPLNRISAGTPNSATKNPPAALPIILSAFRLPFSSADACISAESPTTRGSRLFTAGFSTLLHTALTAATPSTCQTCIRPCQASTPRPSITAPQTASLPTIIARLLYRSASTPPSGCSTSAPR